MLGALQKVKPVATLGTGYTTTTCAARKRATGNKSVAKTRPLACNGTLVYVSGEVMS